MTDDSQLPDSAEHTGPGRPPATDGGSVELPVCPLPVRSGRRRRFACVLLLSGAMFVAVLPQLVSGTSLRHQLLNQIGGSDTTVTATSVQLSWFAPTVATALQVRKADQTATLDAESVHVEKSFLDIMKGTLDKATVTLHKPTFRFVVGDSDGAVSPLMFPQMRARVVDGELKIFTAGAKTPEIELPNLNFTMEVRQTPNVGRELIVEPGAVLDHYRLTPELCDRGLGFVAPLLADVTDVEGSVSVRVDAFRLALTESDGIQVRDLRGVVEMHDITSKAGPTVDTIARIVGQVLQREVPTRVQVLKDTRIQFHVENDRVYHSGFAFVLPEVSPDLVLRTTGSVGLDETLDLKLSVEVPPSLAADVPLLAKFVSQPIEVTITGTSDEPVIGMPAGGDLAGFVAERLAPTPEGGPQSVGGAMLRLIQGVAVPAEEPAAQAAGLTGSIINLVRAIRQEGAGADKLADPASTDKPAAPTAAEAARARRLEREQRRRERQQKRRPPKP